MRDPIRVVLHGLLVAGLAVSAAVFAQAPITLHGAVQFNDGHAFTRALEKFQELTAKYYGKPINFVLHKNSELGLEKDYFAYMNQGISVDYAIVSPAHMSTFSKAAPFIDAPFLFRDLDHWNKVLDADTLKPVADEVSAKGDVMLIGFAGGGTRNIFANKPVRNMAEMKGLKVRVQGAPIWSKTFGAAGMSPTVIAYDEVYNAIQNGVIQAGENEAAGVEAMKFYEVGPNLNMTQHAITIRPICFSGKTFKKLPPDLQAAILKAGKEAGIFGRQIESGADEEKLDCDGKGGQAEADPVRRPRRDEEGRRSGDGRVREGNRRRGHLQQDQLDVAIAERSGGSTLSCAGLFLPDASPHATRESPMSKFIAGYYRLLNWLLVATVAILIIPVSLQIFSRFTALIPSYIWTEEMARFFFIWMIMIGAMVGIRDGAHFDVDLWPELKPRANALLRMVSSVFVLVMALVFIWYGIKFVQFGWSQNSELAELPMPFIFAAWPLAGFTWVLFLGENFLADLRTLSITRGRKHDAAARHCRRRSPR